MVNINELDPEVLYRILCLASGRLVNNINKWKLKLMLLQVCTKWYDLLKSYVFSQGFVVIKVLEDSKVSDSDISTTSDYSPDNRIVCRSNLGIITGRDKNNCDYVTRLDVNIDFLHISQYVHLLKNLLRLGVGYWLNLVSLEFHSTVEDFSLSEFAQSNLDLLSSTASRYIHDFQNRLPNITNLFVDVNEDVTLKAAFYIFIDHYAPRLQTLDLNYTINQSLPLFLAELTYLSLDLRNYTHQNLSVYAKALQCLRLDNIPSSVFSWWLFHDFTTPGLVEFANLEELDLSYHEQTDEEKRRSEKYSKQARPYGTHILRFPKLKDLLLYNPPVDCDVFYTDEIPAELDRLRIRGSCDSVVAASKLRFKSVNKMHIALNKEAETLNNDFYIAADRYFGYTKIGSNCIVVISSSFEIQRTVSWVNVTDLILLTIGFDELLKHIPNLYNLRKLTVSKIYLSNESLSIIRLGLAEEEQGKFKLLDTRLESFPLGRIEPNSPYNLLAILNHLLLRTTTLRNIEIGYGQYSLVEKSFLPEKFPHVKFS